ncbi:hypothetical protein Goklo_005795, partial [Gossypium klotzschianum]|nr:hypothetical protein [Gossypium klotzschianum]
FCVIVFHGIRVSRPTVNGGGDSKETEAWEIEEEVVAGEPFLEPVVNGAPWTFNNHLLVFHHLKQGEDPLEVDLLFTEFWIQIHNLPPRMFTIIIAKQFGDFIGTFVDYDVKAIATGLRNYMQIRILNNAGYKTNSMEVGFCEEDRPIIVGDRKKRPRPNNDSFGSSNEELRWKMGELMVGSESSVCAKKYYPQIFFFMETKVERTKMEKIRRKYGFANGFDVLAQ